MIFVKYVETSSFEPEKVQNTIKRITNSIESVIPVKSKEIKKSNLS